MAFLNRFSKSPTIEDLKVEFDKFLNGHTLLAVHPFSAKQIRGATHSGLYVLRHMPSTRDSVFEFISKVYEKFVKEYMAQAIDSSVSFSYTP